MERPSLPERLSALPERVSELFRPRRWRRGLGTIAAALGLSAVFAASLLGGALLHLDSRPVRHVAQRLGNRFLATLFEGKIVAGEIESIGFREVRIRDAQVLDPQGRQVIEAHSLIVKFATTRLLESLWADDGAIFIGFPRIQIAEGRVTLREGEETVTPSIADTFVLRDQTPTSPSSKARPVTVWLPRIEIAHVAVDGSVARPLDADLRKLVGAVAVDDDVVTVDVKPTGLDERTYLLAESQGTASYHLRVDTNAKRAASVFEPDEDGVPRPVDPVAMWIEFAGRTGDIEVNANGTIKGTRLDATAVLPKITPAALHGMLPQVPLTRDASATLKVVGDLPEMSLQLSAELPQGSGIGFVTAHGRLAADVVSQLEVSFETSELDPASFIDGLPDARVNGRGRMRAVFGEGEPHLSLEAATTAMTVGGFVVPAVDLVVDLVHGDLIGSATVHEPGIPTDARFVVDENGKVHFGVVASTDGLDQAPRLGGAIAGAGTVEVEGDFDGLTLKADVKGSMRGVRAEGFSAQTANITGKIEGPVFALRGSARVQADTVVAQGQPFDNVVVDADGPILTPFVKVHVDDRELGKISAEGNVSVAERGATGVSFKVERNGVVAKGKAARIGVRDTGAFVAEGLALEGEGLGAIGGSLVVDRGDLLGKLKAEDVDLDKIGRLLGASFPVGGQANIDVDVSRKNGGRTGHVEIELEQGEVLTVGGISARLSTKLDGKDVETSGYVRLVATATPAERAEAASQGFLAESRLCDGTIAEVRVSNAKAALAGPLLSASTWTGFVGQADLSAENWNLHCLSKLAPPGLPLPFSEISGLVTTRVHIARREGDRYPSLEDVYVRTHGLEVVGPRKLLSADKPWESRSIDGQLKGSIDGKTGMTEGHVMLFDGTILADLGGTATIDLPKVVLGITDPKKRLADQIVTVLRGAPFDVSASIPQRTFSEFSTLPTFLRDRLPALGGNIRIDAEAHGNFDAPYAYLTVQAFHVSPRAEMGVASSWTPPVDVDLTATYEADDGKAAMEAHFIHDGSTVATLNGEIDIAPTDLPRMVDGPVPWKGGFYASLTDLPLGSIPALSDRDIAGPASGTVSLSGLNVDPKVDVNLSLPFLRLGELYFDARVVAHMNTAASAKANTDGTAEAAGTAEPGGAIDASTAAALPVIQTGGTASFELDLDGQDGGSLQVLAYSGAAWGSKAIPMVDPESAGGLVLSAKKFRLGAFYPVVSGSLSKLDGTIDGSAQLKWGKLDEADQGRIQGNLKVRDAVLFIPQFGQELRRGKADIVATPDGNITVENLEASGITGRLHGKASAHFDGVKLQTAKGEVTVDDNQEIPVTFEGVPLGSASGHFLADLAMKADQLALDIHVPNVRVALPASIGRDVQGLGDDPTIHLSDLLAPPEKPATEHAMQYEISIKLDKGEVTGSGLDAVVATAAESPVRVSLGSETRVTGDVVVRSGSVELRQKKFEFDRGLVRMRAEDASNPYVNVTAHWDGPDGGRVFVDYAGNLLPITDDKIRFRSDPPRSKEDIIATLLFGTDLSSTEKTGSAAPDATKGAGGFATDVGGTVASQALNALISSRFVTLTFDSNDTGGLRGKIEWRASEGVTLGLSGEQVQATQAGTTGVPASQTANQNGAQGEVSLEWKFAKNWSLRSSVGAGVREPSTALDVLWQYRY